VVVAQASASHAQATAEDLDSRVTDLEDVDADSRISDLETTVSSFCDGFSNYEGAFADIYFAAC
jgi:hypothetical protein